MELKNYSPQNTLPSTETVRTVSNPNEEFNNTVSRIVIGMLNWSDRKTFGVFQSTRKVAFIAVGLIITYGVFTPRMFRGEWRHHNKSQAAAAIMQTRIVEGFEGLNGTVDESTGEKFDGQKKNSSTPANDGVIELPLKMSFDLSPASPEELRAQNVKAYIARFSKVAVAEMDKFGIPASVTMAQAIVESRSGTSVLAVRNNNHFGIKCFSKTCPKGHCTCYTDDHHKDFFFVYGSAAESFRAHSVFLMKYRYRDLLKYGKNYRVWAKGLREFGYATDQTYDKKLISIIERYGLNKLDDL